jgi:2,3-bisphosphoglycerate-independent phosphoglycerate mutase
MDGVGVGNGDAADAVAAAKTPTLDALRRRSYRTLLAHGTAVGMPSDADMGNSEVGHNALGAGRIFAQGAALVERALAGDIFQGACWQDLTAHLRRTGGTLHLIGLLSDGNVHSHIDHVKALCSRAPSDGVFRLRIHALLDGRDVPPQSAHIYIENIESHFRGDQKIASGGGRMTTTMDRYGADWSMVERGWRAHVQGVGPRFSCAGAAVRAGRPLDDQNLGPFVVVEDGEPVGRIVDGDAVLLFNFRGDRMLELTRAFEDDVFPCFDRGPRPHVFFAGMTLYDGDAQRPKRFLVSPPAVTCTYGELLCDAGIRQLACSETQKFGHVTYFWNGNRSGYFDRRLEEYIEVPSPPQPFDARPEMSADAITDAVLQRAHRFDFIRVNFANGDMVGHTGNFEATVRGVETVDRCLARLRQAGLLVVTADHGNADDMAQREHGQILYDAAGRMVPRTSHSLNPVPFMIDADLPLASGRGHLGHVMPSIAQLLGFDPPHPGLLAVPASSAMPQPGG